MRTISVIIGISLVLLALVAAALVFGTSAAPPPMRSIVDGASAMDRTGMPPVSRFRARDGELLAYRAYPVPGATRIGLLFHGASDSSQGLHSVAKTLSEAGVAAYAVDVRGHGDSGPHGDIGYIGQLEDDLVDLVAHLKGTYPQARIVLFGHSAGGGFVLRMAGSESSRLFERFLVTSPYLGHDAVTSRGVEGGGWARPYTPRLVVLDLMHSAGLDVLQGLPVIAFALPQQSTGTRTYSYRLLRNYAAHDDYIEDVRRGGRPITVLAGTADEVFFSERYEDAFRPIASLVRVQLLDGLNHMAMLSDQRALAAIRTIVTSN